MKEEIKKIFLTVFPSLNEEYDWEKHQKEYDDWDSFAQLQLITMAEESFGIEIDLDDAVNITSGKDLFNCVKSLK